MRQKKCCISDTKQEDKLEERERERHLSSVLSTKITFKRTVGARAATDKVPSNFTRPLSSKAVNAKNYLTGGQRKRRRRNTRRLLCMSLMISKAKNLKIRLVPAS